MAERKSPMPNTEGSWPRSIDCVMFRLGYLQATCDRILKAVTAMQTAPTPTSGLMPQWRWLKDRLAELVLLQKAWSAWRTISWPVSFGSWGYIVGRALGWL